MPRLIDADALIIDLMDAGLDQIQMGDYSEVIQVIERQTTVNQWHRVEEPPKYSGKVFVWMEREGDFFDKEYIADAAYYNNLAGGRIPKGTFFKPIPGKMEYEILDTVTHWMPIEPPKEGE